MKRCATCNLDKPADQYAYRSASCRACATTLQHWNRTLAKQRLGRGRNERSQLRRGRPTKAHRRRS